MPIYKSHGDTYRRYFEESYGISIRHDAWLKYKQELQLAGLDITKENVQTYAKIKKLRPRSVITKFAIDKMRGFTAAFSLSRPSFRGCEIKDLVLKTVPNFKEDTFYKCFNSATHKKFKGVQVYEYEEAATVLSFCLVVDPTRYRPRRKNQVTTSIQNLRKAS